MRQAVKTTIEPPRSETVSNIDNTKQTNDGHNVCILPQGQVYLTGMA